MRRNVLDVGLLRVAFQDQPEPLARQALAAVIQEERGRIGAPGQRRPATAQVLAQHLHRPLAHRDRSLTAGLAEAAGGAGLEIKRVEVERHEFAHPHPGRVERLHHRQVAQRLGRVELARLLQQQGDLADRDRLGEIFVDFGRVEPIRWIGSHHPLGGQVMEEGLDCGRLARHGRVGILPAPQEEQEVDQMRRRDVRPADSWLAPTQVVDELAEVVAVGGDRIRRELLHRLQMPQELIDLLVHERCPPLCLPRPPRNSDKLSTRAPATNAHGVRGHMLASRQWAAPALRSDLPPLCLSSLPVSHPGPSSESRTG